MSAIIVVSVVVGLMMAFMVRRTMRRRHSGAEVGDEKDTPASFRKAGQNAPKDQSEALNIEMDGSGFRDAVISSSGTNGTHAFNFDSGIEVDSEMGSPAAKPNTSTNMFAPSPPSQLNGRRSNGSGNGHGMML